MDDVRIEIEWDGHAPGLDHHRVSIDTWVDSLKTLQGAIRRKASNMLAEAEGTGRGDSGGRLAREASSIDVQIETLEEGSTKVTLVVASLMAQISMWGPTLIADAVANVGADILAESQGHPRNKRARDYLASVPSGVAKHRLRATVGARELFDNRLDGAEVGDLPPPLPALLQGWGEVAGVFFDPPEVVVVLEGKRLRCSAQQEQVDLAVAQHDQTVHVAVVRQGSSHRLVWLRTEEPRKTRPVERDVHFRSRWAETLRILGS